MTVTVTLPVGTTPLEAFPSEVLDVEDLVFQHVKAAAAPGPASRLPYYGDGRPDQPGVYVSRGWPAYPGKVPAIGVAEGTESEDQATQVIAGGLAGDVVAVDATGALIGSASYYAEPLYTPIVVTLIHENRDERDRLHQALRLVLPPLRRVLPATQPRVRQVSVDAEKSEVSGGPPAAEKPFLLYTSIFTVHVHHELMQAVDVTDASGVIVGVPVSVTQVAADYTPLSALASALDDE